MPIFNNWYETINLLCTSNWIPFGCLCTSDPGLQSTDHPKKNTVHFWTCLQDGSVSVHLYFFNTFLYRYILMYMIHNLNYLLPYILVVQQYSQWNLQQLVKHSMIMIKTYHFRLLAHLFVELVINMPVQNISKTQFKIWYIQHQTRETNT